MSPLLFSGPGAGLGALARLPLAARFQPVIGLRMAILRHRALYFNVIHRLFGPDSLGK
ncbi:MAG: hypothetical protein ACPHIA_02295 [Alphaproteobacteria bacterium]